MPRPDSAAMWQLLINRLRRNPVAPPRLVTQPAGPPQRRLATTPDLPVVPAATVSPAEVAPAGVGARRPLVATDGRLAGFEFHVGPALLERLRRHQNHPASRAVVEGLLAAMRLSLSPGRVALAELPAHWLALIQDDSAFISGMWLLTSADADAGLVARLQRLQVRVGWRPDQVPAGVRPDFLLGSAAQATSAPAWPGVPWVLLDAPDVDTMESMLRPPVMLAACSTAATTETVRSEVLAPQVQHLMSLLARLVRDEDQAGLVADIKGDASLALRLLQHMNSAGATPGRVLASIDEAVMYLGRDALYRWCANLLVRLGPTRPAAAALQALALSRARLFEQLARSDAEPEPGRLYLLGLASLLPLLLRSSVADAFAAFQLPEEAYLAMSQGTGPWAHYLALARALEQPDMEAARPLAERFGGLPAVLTESARSWA